MADNVFKKAWGNDIFRIIVSLAIVGSASGMALVFVYNYASPKISINIKHETEKAIRNIFPGTEKVGKTSEKGVYKAESGKGELLGYAFVAEGNGYQGIIRLIAGVDPAITEMKGMEVLESSETPGLGAEIANPPFRNQFSGLKLDHAIEYVKNQKPQEDYQIEAITGATISSRAVVNILNKRIDEVRKLIKAKQ
ncbi:MAG: FMN-binding protein [Candidatus Omnitrophica bacterium]|nr:FMN-binding protein [Candidatus Omnitrophota bacterium]